MSEMPRLARGDEGEWVTYLQEVLASRGYETGSSDTTFDAALEDVVRQFQADSGLTEDGVVDTRSWAVLTPDEATAEGGEQSIEIDWDQLPWLSMLLQYEESEEGITQFLIANDVSADLLAIQE